MKLEVLTDQQISKMSLAELNQAISMFGNALNDQLKELQELARSGETIANNGIKYLKSRAGVYNPKARIDHVADQFFTESTEDRDLAIKRLKVLMKTYQAQSGHIEGLRSMANKRAKTLAKHLGVTHLTTDEAEALTEMMDILKSYGWSSADIANAFYRERTERKFGGDWDAFIKWCIECTTGGEFDYDYFEYDPNAGPQEEFLF